MQMHVEKVAPRSRIRIGSLWIVKPGVRLAASSVAVVTATEPGSPAAPARVQLHYGGPCLGVPSAPARLAEAPRARLLGDHGKNRE